MKEFNLNAPKVTRDEALELMVHHLELADMYYEATANDYEAVLREVECLLERRCSSSHTAPSVFAARAFLAEMKRIFYEEFKIFVDKLNEEFK